MIDDLLSAARLEPLAPEPGAAAAAWAEVSRRRHKRILRAQVGAGVGLVLIVLVGLLPSLDEGERASKLDVAGPASDRRRVEVPSLLDTETDDEPAVEGGRAVAAAAPSGGAPSPAVDAPAPGPSRPGAAAPAPGRTKPPIERSRYQSLYIGCLEWCLSPRVAREGEMYALNLDLCVGVGAGTRRFSYSTFQEVDFWVTTIDTSPDTLWTWSLGQQFAVDEHSVDISSRECVRWAAVWDGTDEGGEPLPPGDYRLFAKSLAEEAERGSTTQTTFRIY